MNEPIFVTITRQEKYQFLVDFWPGIAKIIADEPAPLGDTADRIATLRQAFDATMKDPAFLADAKRLQMEVNPLPGAAVETLLRTAYAAPQAIIARAAPLIP